MVFVLGALRLTNTYGPGMRIKDARQTFVGIWIRQLLQGKPFEVWGGEQLRDFNYVEDVVDAFLIAAVNKNADGKIFNLGSDEVVSLKQLAELLLEVAKTGQFKIREFPEERKKIDIGDYYSDYQLINQTLGWKAKTSLYDGLEKTIVYYKEYGKKYF